MAMAAKAANTVEAPEAREESEAPLLDAVAQSIKRMVAKSKERGYITYDELNAVLPADQVSSEQIEDTMTMLSELGVNVVESEEGDAEAEAESETEAEDSEDLEPRAAGNVDEADIGRTDDPVRMYLREMGSVELLSREGEIAIAKRIEAGREMMIGGICESPLTMRALIEWRNSLHENKMLLRDIIDLDATYGNAGAEKAAAGEEVDEDEEEVADGADEPRRGRGRCRRRRCLDFAFGNGGRIKARRARSARHDCSPL